MVGEVGDARRRRWTACAELRPDVVLADLGLPAGDARCRQWHRPGPAWHGVLLGARARPRRGRVCARPATTTLVAGAMRAGARGCVDMGADGPELARAVVAAGRGQAILSGPVLGQLHRGLRDDDPEQPLTERERQVRGLMEQGLPDKVIAERLVLSVKTVEKHAGRGAAEDRRAQPHRARRPARGRR